MIFLHGYQTNSWYVFWMFKTIRTSKVVMYQNGTLFIGCLALIPPSP